MSTLSTMPEQSKTDHDGEKLPPTSTVESVSEEEPAASIERHPNLQYTLVGTNRTITGCTLEELLDSRGQPIKPNYWGGGYRICESGWPDRTLKRGSNDRQAKSTDGGGDIFGLAPAPSSWGNQTFIIRCRNRGMDLCACFRGSVDVQYKRDSDFESRWLFEAVGRDSRNRPQYNLFTWHGDVLPWHDTLMPVNIDKDFEYTSSSSAKYEITVVLIPA
ncbi:hypothetical protein PG999_002887 [Apiospora kogelbergensis]|uniref:Uncharacterized protein n=1 Tax=Apiospora kogelbergensis TaxID=1337665 RepID=A0AAW0R9D9_9PEZI